MILGHERIIRDFKELADGHNLAHGYLFFGPKHVGKKLVALSLANYLENGKFEHERTEHKTPILIDLFLLDKNTGIGIDSIREIKNFLWQRPAKSKYRTTIIDIEEPLANEAQNALLKITEEPPETGLLILVTHDPEALNPTVLSRFQKIYFGTVPEEEVKKWAKNQGMKDIKSKFFGKPGYTVELNDKEFKKIYDSVGEIIRSSFEKRRLLIKKIIEPDDFNIGQFLDACMIYWVENFLPKRERLDLWHKILKLRGETTYFNLNPRLQLENLFLSSK